MLSLRRTTANNNTSNGTFSLGLVAGLQGISRILPKVVNKSDV